MQPAKEGGEDCRELLKMSLSAAMEDDVAFCAPQIFTLDKFKLYTLPLGQQSAIYGPCASFVTPLD